MTFNGSDSLRAISRWTGVQQAEVRAVIESEEQFDVHADVEGNLTPWPIFQVKAAGLVMHVEPTDVQVGIEGLVEMDLSHRPQVRWRCLKRVVRMCSYAGGMLCRTT